MTTYFGQDVLPLLCSRQDLLYYASSDTTDLKSALIHFKLCCAVTIMLESGFVRSAPVHMPIHIFWLRLWLQITFGFRHGWIKI